MCLRVIADGVSGGGNLVDDVGALLNVFSDEKKCGLHIVVGEDIEEEKGVGVIGAIVIGESEFASVAGSADEGVSVELGAPGEGVVSGKAETSDCGCADGEGEHGGECSRFVIGDWRFV